MGNRNRKKPRKQRKSLKESGQQGPVFFKHPLSDLPRDQLIIELVEHAKAATIQFQERLGTILGILRSNEPLQTITTLAVFGLSGAVTDEGTYASLLKNSRFTQAHVELAQALSLTIPPADIRSTPPGGLAIQQLFDVLPELGESFAHRRMVVMGQDRSDEQKAITLIQELLRMHTQTVRNWGYFDKVIRIVNELYKPLDNAFREHVGLSATEIAAAFLFLVRSSERQMNAALKQMFEVLSEPTVDRMVRRYYQLNPHIAEPPERLLLFLVREKLSIEQTKMLIASYVQYRLPEIYTFSAASIASEIGVGEEPTKNVLDKLSFSFGDLAPQKIDHLLLSNPVWRKPVIKIGQSQYFCAIPQMFFSFVRPILDDLIADNQALEQACDKRRAKFLETELAQLFKRAFPNAEIVAGFKWKDGDREYENDLLVRVDSHLILIEAKSATVSWPALRGAPDRAKKHIDDLFIAPSIQSARLAERIKAVLKSPELRDSYLPDMHVRLDQVHTVLRLSVTLEDFAMIQSNLGELRRTGWLPQNHSLAPCMLLTDLEVIFDILEPMGQKIHYLRRRTELAARMTTMGDELGHLGLYLGNGFNIGEAEFGDSALHLFDMSKEIDGFCVARAEGIHVQKPRLRLGKWWSDICSAVERRGFHRWTDVYNILLSLSPEEQENAERMFKEIKNKLRGSPKGVWKNDSVVAIPSPSKVIATAIYAFHDADSAKRSERMQSIATQTFDHPNVEKCLVIAVNIDREGDPYATLAVFTRNESPEQAKVDDLLVY